MTFSEFSTTRHINNRKQSMQRIIICHEHDCYDMEYFKALYSVQGYLQRMYISKFKKIHLFYPAKNLHIMKSVNKDGMEKRLWMCNKFAY